MFLSMHIYSITSQCINQHAEGRSDDKLSLHEFSVELPLVRLKTLSVVLFLSRLSQHGASMQNIYQSLHKIMSVHQKTWTSKSVFHPSCLFVCFVLLTQVQRTVSLLLSHSVPHSSKTKPDAQRKPYVALHRRCVSVSLSLSLKHAHK